MKDVAGRELSEGDKVATSRGGYTSSLVIGEVVGFTPKKVKLRFPVEYSRVRFAPEGYEDILKFPEQVCKI